MRRFSSGLRHLPLLRGTWGDLMSLGNGFKTCTRVAMGAPSERGDSSGARGAIYWASRGFIQRPLQLACCVFHCWANILFQHQRPDVFLEPVTQR